MKSYTLKILLLITSLTVISCMPDSVTKFKEDPPKKAPVVSSGGTVVVPLDFHPTNPMLCPSGNGSTTTEGAGVDIVTAAPIPANFVIDTVYQTSPFSVDGVNNPNHELILRGDTSAIIQDFAGNDAVICILADDSATTQYHPYFTGGVETTIEDFIDDAITWSISPTLPTGLVFDILDGSVAGVATGYNELAAYTVSATNVKTGTIATGQIEIASSTPLKMVLDADTTNDTSSAFYYTQYTSASYTAIVADASSLIPNHYIVNQLGALALIDHVDYSTNKVHLTIKTPTANVFNKLFTEGEAIDHFNPDQVAAAARVFNSQKTTLDSFFAVVKTGSSLGDSGSGTDNFALHWDAASGFVSATTTDGLTATTGEEIHKWIRCSYTPSLAGFGVSFANGEDSTITQFSDIDNWGTTIGSTATINAGIGLDRACEFNGIITSAFNETTVTTKVYSYSGEESTTEFNLQAADIVQPRPLINNSAADETNFFFHYQYAGSDSTKLILEVDDVSTFKYNSQVPDENKISNGRGTSGVITFIDVANKKLFVTLENNQAYAFVNGDEIDNTGTFLSSETTIVDLEYTFELGKVADANSYFEPKIALVKATMPVDVNAAGLVITPFGSNEFSTAFLKQININGSFSILGDSNSIQSRTISAVDLSPNAHQITVSSAFTDGIPSNVSQTAYVSPFENAYELGATENIGFCEGDRTQTTSAGCTGGGGSWISEKGSISYVISNYSGISTSTCTARCDINDQVLAGTTAAAQIVFKPGSKITDANHGRIVISNDLNTLLSTQTFTITATGFAGNQATAEFAFSVSAPPANLSLSRNLLLNVPSGSAFVIGSYISSNNADAGKGIVKDIITAVENTYDYLDIQVIQGEFGEFDDLDNRPKFNSQRTYILGDGVIKYNAAVELNSIADAQEFDDAFKCTTNKRYNRFIDSGSASFDDNAAVVATAARGTIAYQWDTFSGDTSQLRPTANNRVYLQVERGELVSTDSINAANCATSGAFDQGANVINEIISDNMYIEYAADADFIAGFNITSNDGTNRGAGVVHSTNAANDRAYIGQYYHLADGIFLTGQDIDNINPFAATETTITNTALDHAFYLYRYEEASIQFTLGIGPNPDGTIPSDTVVEFLEYDGNGYCSTGISATNCGTGNTDCSSHTTRTQCENDASYLGSVGGIKWVTTEAATVPTGLTFDTATGRIFGTPVVNSDKQKYTLRVTNPYGVVEHDFELKVYDKYQVLLSDTAASPKPDSFMMHQIGFGMASVPCRVTREAMDTAASGLDAASISDVIDLTCVLDAGESDLFANGIDLTIRTGDAMCSTIQHTPFYFMGWQHISSATSVVENAGDFADPLCGTQPQFEAIGDANAPGAVASPATPAAGADLGIDAATGMCETGNGGSNYEDQDSSFPNCDDGIISVSPQNFTANEFSCTDSNGTETNDDTFAACDENAGECVAGGDVCASCPTAGDCTSCADRTTCTVSGNNWNFLVTQHNDSANGGTASPSVGCTVDALDPALDNDCGGSIGECMEGAGKGILSDEELADKDIELINMLGENETNIEYLAPLSSGHKTNLKLANYMNSNSCITPNNYTFDWTNYILSSAETVSGSTQPFAGGRNYYEYSCDSGAGLLARVRMLVRDFDNTFSIDDLIGLELPGTPNRMDDNLGGGDLCAFPGADGCNDRSDFDNFYTGGACGDAALDFDFLQPDGTVEDFPQQAL